MIPREEYIIRIPFIGELTTSSYCEGTSLNDAQYIQTEVKEYRLTTKVHDTLVYDLIIKKESKKMSSCGCICDKKESHLCYCVDDCRCTCIKRKCCNQRPYRISLLGFKGTAPTRILSKEKVYNTLDTENAMLRESEKWRNSYDYFKILAIDINNKTLSCKDVVFKDVPSTIVKATLC